MQRVSKWLFPTALLCLYGFFKEFKPSEPFLNPFLTHNRSDPDDPGKGFSNAAAENDIYPFWTYSYLVAEVFTLLLTDFLVYKPVIILECLAYLTTRVLLVAAFGLLSMQLMELLYGIASATEVAYYSYIYVMIDKKHYKYATSFTRAAVLLGRALSGYLGQALYSTGVLNLLACTTSPWLVLWWHVCLPSCYLILHCHCAPVRGLRDSKTGEMLAYEASDLTCFCISH